ncbi:MULTISPECIES: HipA domain-containing protein [unclassified Leucobacter]|uniref:HipA domain-containing protein n=1 Tax=unclassified Leucobacter TaxID=2621730 RepID=UPI001F53DD2B|nr:MULTISPECIES: HipA domain-containing protein [unclassified Leucobacter]
MTTLTKNLAPKPGIRLLTVPRRGPKMPTIDVYLYGQLAAKLERLGHSSYRLKYTPDWLSHSQAVPLSTQLPLRPQPYTGDPLLRVLSGFLPDREEVLARWAGEARLADTEPFGLLEHYGEDVAGAAVFVPEDKDPLAEREATTIDDSTVANRIRGIREDPRAWIEKHREHRFSLAGMQGKFALALRNGQWLEPSGAEPSTHILKPGIEQYPDSEILEHVVMRTAAGLGLPVAQTSILRFEDQRILCVERFDRTEVDGTVFRIHQEDFAQATGTPPARKYEEDGGPSPADIARVLRREAEPALVGNSLATYGASLVFSWLLAHNDGHSKNYSLRLYPRQIELTPLYDLNSYLPYADAGGRIRGRDLSYAHEVELSFSIRGASRIGDLTGAHWNALEEILSLPRGTLVEYGTAAAESLMPAVNAAIDSLEPEFQTEVVDQFRQAAFLRRSSALEALSA